MSTGKVAVIWDVATGSFVGVEKDGKPVQQSGTVIGAPPDSVILINKPDSSVCCIIHGGKLYCWC